VSGQKTCGIGKCHIDREVDYFGNDLPGKKKIPVNNEQDCVVLCYTTPQCSFWTYSPSKNLCWLKDGKDRVQYNKPDRVSGDKTCGAEIPSVIWDGWDWCSRSDLDKEYRDGIFPLIDAVNSYRRANGFRNLPCDAVLVEVAYLHVKDQEAAGIESSTCEKNGHNWLSTIGFDLAEIATLLPQYSDNVVNIKTCCLKTDGGDCMWLKPNELYSWYKEWGYEVSVELGSEGAGASPQAAAKEALSSWKDSKGHNDVLLAKGKWKNAIWKNIGCFRRGKWANCWLS